LTGPTRFSSKATMGARSAAVTPGIDVRTSGTLASVFPVLSTTRYVAPVMLSLESLCRLIVTLYPVGSSLFGVDASLKKLLIRFGPVTGQLSTAPTISVPKTATTYCCQGPRVGRALGAS
jgi:hypothetical protein